MTAELLRFAWSEAHPPRKIDVLPEAVLQPRLTEPPADSGVVVFPVPKGSIDAWLAPPDTSAEDTTDGVSSGACDAKARWLTAEPHLSFKVRASGRGDRLVRFWSRNAAGDTIKPRLMVFITARDSASGEMLPDTLDLTPNGDLFLVVNDSTDTGGWLVVGSGAGFETDIRFDLTPLWQSAGWSHIVVNRAVVTLHKAPAGWSTLPETPSIWPARLTDDRWLTEADASGEAAFVTLPVAVDPDAETFEIAITGLTAEWVLSPQDNFGLALHSGGEGLNLDRIAFHSVRDPDSTKHPTLTVYYTEFPR